MQPVSPARRCGPRSSNAAPVFSTVELPPSTPSRSRSLDHDITVLQAREPRIAPDGRHYLVSAVRTDGFLMLLGELSLTNDTTYTVDRLKRSTHHPRILLAAATTGPAVWRGTKPRPFSRATRSSTPARAATASTSTAGRSICRPGNQPGSRATWNGTRTSLWIPRASTISSAPPGTSTTSSVLSAR